MSTPTFHDRLNLALKAEIEPVVPQAKTVAYILDHGLRIEDCPAVIISVGNFTQAVAGGGNVPGQRVFLRTYDLSIACVDNTKTAGFIASVNALADAITTALANFTAMTDPDVEDLQLYGGQYEDIPSEEGVLGSLILDFSVSILVYEQAPNVEIQPPEGGLF